MAIAGILWLTSSANAQQRVETLDAPPLRGIVGETVSVLDATGGETRGRIFAISDRAIALTVGDRRHVLDSALVRRIERRRRDSVWNGVLIGAGAGALLGYGAGRRLDSPSCPRSGIECGQGAMLGTVGGAFWGAFSGWIDDALVRKTEVIHVAPREG
jgi:hypothetical protein